MNPTEFLLLLHSVPHIGEKALARLLRLTTQQRLTPETFLSLTAEDLKSRYELHPQAAQALDAQRDELIAQSAETARLLRTHRLHLISIESATYPSRLDRYEDAPPPLLYAVGNLSLLDWSYTAERFTFSIAVSNGASAEILARLDQIAADLSAAGGVPVTGHDRTPYKRMALAAQRLHRPTIYVLDRGLREALGPEFDRPPFAAARIRDAFFDRERDLAFSPFRLDDHSLGANNRRRDALVFALSDLVVALDVRSGGSMMEACTRAWKQGRSVYVADGGRDGNAILCSQGCRLLPSNGKWIAQVRQAIRQQGARQAI